MVSSNNKRLVKNTLLLYVRMLFTMGVGFYTSRVVLDVLGVVDYGVYNVVGGVVGMIGALYGPMAIATQRWITFALGKGDREMLKKVFSVCLSSQLLIAVLLLVAIEIGGLWYLNTYAVIPPERMEVASWVFQLSAVTMSLTILNVPFHGAIIAHEEMGAFAAFAIVEVLMKLIICFALPHASVDKLWLYALLLFCTSVFSFLFVQGYACRKFEEARWRFGWDKRLYKQITSFAAWDIVGNLAFIGYSQGTTLLVNMFYGPAMNAAAGIGGQATNVINQLSANFQTALNPQITKYYAAENLPEMHKLIFRSVKFSFFLVLVFAVPFFYEAEFLLHVWLVEVPPHAVAFMRLGLFVCLLGALRSPLITAAMATGNVRRFQLSTNAVMLSVCPVAYVVYKLGGVAETASIVFVVALIGAILVSVHVLGRLIKLGRKQFMTDVLGRVVLVAAVSFALPYYVYVTIDEGWGRLFLITFLSCIFTALAVYGLGADRREKGFMAALVREKVLKVCR